MSDKSEAITISLRWADLQLTRLIHEHFSIIMAYAFSTPALSRWVEERFVEEWKYLNQALFEMPVPRTNLALLELATQLRLTTKIFLSI
jgi:hypothetical protein